MTKFIQFVILFCFFAGCSTNSNLREVKHPANNLQFATEISGKLWQIDQFPLDEVNSKYKLNLARDWVDSLKLTALKFGDWCSASFVSEVGLILTNHHCAEQLIEKIELDGEYTKGNWFLDDRVKDQCKIDGFKLKQLVFIKDVTSEMARFDDRKEDKFGKELLRLALRESLIAAYENKTGFFCEIISYHNGARHSTCGLKIFDDIRAVFIPELDAGYSGGGKDNITFPRFSFDCSFYRVYKNGKLAKVKNFLKWNLENPKKNEQYSFLITSSFTNRYKTVSQLKYLRDYSLKFEQYKNSKYIEISYAYKNTTSDTNRSIESEIYQFEKILKAKVIASNELSNKYKFLWNAIADVNAEMAKIAIAREAYKLDYSTTLDYFMVAENILKWLRQLQKPAKEHPSEYQKDKINETVKEILPNNFNHNLHKLS